MKIRVIATNVREQLEDVYGLDLAGHCMEASETIVEVVTVLGMEANTVEGWCLFVDECYGSDHPWDSHTWVEIPAFNLYGCIIETISRLFHIFDYNKN